MVLFTTLHVNVLYIFWSLIELVVSTSQERTVAVFQPGQDEGLHDYCCGMFIYHASDPGDFLDCQVEGTTQFTDVSSTP